MKHLALLAAIYALIVALVLPGSILAQEEAAPAEDQTAAAEPAPAQQAPAEQAPAEPAPAPAAPAGPAPAEPAPAEPAPAPAEPQVVLDERDGTKPAKPKAIAAASSSVTIADFSFAPASITISQGDTVTWTNNGPTPHSATATNGSFDTGIFPEGQSRTHTFNEAGTFSYICTPHPYMKGTVVVQASQTGGDTEDSSGSGGSGSGTAGAEASQADDGPTLPNTGSDAGALLLLGGLMLLLGVAVHRRSRADDAQPAGRIGW
jgi:LPXTG-motif cell wall-anchored protein